MEGFGSAYYANGNRYEGPFKDDKMHGVGSCLRGNNQWASCEWREGEKSEFAWNAWSLDWNNPSPGEHTVTSRAIDTAGQIQPAMDDPWIANKHTYWESNGHVTRRVTII